MRSRWYSSFAHSSFLRHCFSVVISLDAPNFFAFDLRRKIAPLHSNLLHQFETALPLSRDYGHYQIQALDGHRHVLGTKTFGSGSGGSGSGGPGRGGY